MLPSWVKGRDGRLEPFDADAISERLFAAAQSLGAADAFLVRELTDGVLHFLTQEDLGDTAASDAIDDVVVKVVRELGQPALAQAFDQRVCRVGSSAIPNPLVIAYSAGETPDDVAKRCLDQFSLRSVFSPDVAAAHEQGLIRLGGLASPRTMEAVVLEPARLGDRDPFDTAWDLVATGAVRGGRRLVLDGPEWILYERPDEFVRGLDRAAQAHDRWLDLHVNAATPPAWAEARGDGPLFAGETPTKSSSSPQAWLASMGRASTRVRLVWRWRDDPAIDGPFVEWLRSSTTSCAVVLDRPRQPVSLMHGLSRRRPGILLRVGLDLPNLLNRPDVACQGDVFLDKLPSLSRLAVSAGVQKRNSLRRHADHLTREFLLDRAAVRIEPVGFSAALQQLMGVPLPTKKPARALAAKILLALHQPLEESRRRTGIEYLLDSPELNADESPIDVLAALNDVARGAIAPDCLHLTVRHSQIDWSALFSNASRKSAIGAIHVEVGASSPAAAQQPGC